MASFLLVADSSVRSRQSPLPVTALLVRCPFLLSKNTPVCVLRWDLSTPAETNARPHSWHVYGFSPVWERTCCFRWLDFLKPLLHQLHLKMERILVLCCLFNDCQPMGQIKRQSLTCRLSCWCPRRCSDSLAFLWLTEVRFDCFAEEAHWSKSQRTQTGITQWR